MPSFYSPTWSSAPVAWTTGARDVGLNDGGGGWLSLFLSLKDAFLIYSRAHCFRNGLALCYNATFKFKKNVGI